MICGSTTLIATCQVDAPSDCALTSCSFGRLATVMARSRIRQGVTPKTISTTFDSSPNPKTMNRMGRIAIGGIIDSTATSVPNVAPATGTTPTASPTVRPIAVATPRPMARRRRLAAVSVHSTRSPERRSGSNASRCAACAISATGGSNLSSGLAARRSVEPTT